MSWLVFPSLAAGAYYCLAILAAFKWRRSPRGTPGPAAALSILKPVHGRDPHFYDAIRSHAQQEYPEFEILFGVTNPHDAALQDIARLQREFPARPISVHVVSTKAPNAKTGVLAELSRRARHPLLLVSDSDIVVEPGYLKTVTAPLADNGVGLVTCLYRASADSWPSRAEALGIATEFVPSVLVARLLGVSGFALGSTMVFRAVSLRAFGGFDAIDQYLADDYQLGRHIAALGVRIEFAPMVVETHLGAQSWTEVWRHQLRWSRTIRVSNPAGYYGYIVTHATCWALAAIFAGMWTVGAAVLFTRILAGVLVGTLVLKDRQALGCCWMIPFRDLFGFAIWLAGIFGRHVRWRDRRLRLHMDGRISVD